jgi:fructoselysine-6-P-deglycase FrlB-like protein
MAQVEHEIASQPRCWQLAGELGVSPAIAGALPQPGERVAAVGCGTSWFIAQSYAVLRELAGHGDTDAYAASEFPGSRSYDRVLAITRSGTTTEVLDLLHGLPDSTATTVVTSDPQSPAMGQADHTIALPFAGETAIVQTRFATSALALLRAYLGEDLTPVIADAQVALVEPLPLDPATIEQITFLGTGASIGIASEAALKCRESALMWAEAYPAMDYRHGPIAIAAPGRAVWLFGPSPAGLAEDITGTGATLVTSDLDPLADLIRVQRLAVALAVQRGLDPDRPRNLTRSVVLR